HPGHPLGERADAEPARARVDQPPAALVDQLPGLRLRAAYPGDAVAERLHVGEGGIDAGGTGGVDIAPALLLFVELRRRRLVHAQDLAARTRIGSPAVLGDLAEHGV